MSEVEKKEEGAPAGDNKGKAEDTRQGRFIRLLQNLNNTVVGITALVVGVGTLITAVVALDHHVFGPGTASASSSPTSSRTSSSSPTAHPSLATHSTQSPRSGSATILAVTDPVHGGCLGSTLRVKLDVISSVPGSGQLWVMVAVGLEGGGTVYDAKAELNNVTGPQTANVELVNSLRGSSRYLFVVSASNQAEFSWLSANQANDGKSGWDINRRDLHGVTRVSNSRLVTSTC